MKRAIHVALAILALGALGGCATNFAPKPLPEDHPASAQAQEAPRSGMRRLVATDELTRRTNAQLARNVVPNPEFQSSGMSHDMSGMNQSQMKGMEGMDHSKMPGMDRSKPAADATSPSPSPSPEGMDHSKMPGMTMPASSAAPSPASNEAAEAEMKKTSDEMKKLSDEMKAKSDAEKPGKNPAKKSAPNQKADAGYWTCVMHPEIHESKPGQCPKCGMTLVKKEGEPK